MKNKYIVLSIITAFVVGSGTPAILSYTPWSSRMTKVHVLKFPLLLTSDEPGRAESLLPTGTMLYFDKGFPEGFTRYKVYININRYPLELTELSDPTLIAPLDARPLEKPDLIRLLKNYPLTKADLEAVLASKRLSKDEVREVFENYLK